MTKVILDYALVMPVGSVVQVLSHRHPDVGPGRSGIIDCAYDGGFGVAITGHWQFAGSDRGATYQGTEVCWYPPEELSPKSKNGS